MNDADQGRAATAERIQDLFSSWVAEEKVNVNRRGVALRISDLRKRLFMAESKIRQLERKHGPTLEELDGSGLPDDAGYEMHEDYVMWHHWAEVVEETRERVATLERIAEQGIYSGHLPHAGD